MSYGRTLLRRYTPTPALREGPAPSADAGPPDQPASDTFDLDLGAKPATPALLGARPVPPPTPTPEPLRRPGTATLVPSAFDASSSIAMALADLDEPGWFGRDPEDTLDHDAEDPHALAIGRLAPAAELTIFFGGLFAGLLVHGTVWAVAWFALTRAT